jgi:tetratricopeptide (TPR) repeat protein
MSLRGDLHTLPFPDLLHIIFARRLTGMLHLSRQAIRKRAVFADGDLLSLTSNDPRETLPQWLLKRGLVTAEQLVDALLEQERDGARLGAILISRCLIEAEDFEQALRMNAEEAVYELFLWTDGAFEFSDEIIDRRALLDLGIKIRALLSEGMRRKGLWEKVGRRLVEKDVVFRSIGPPSPTLPKMAHRVYELAAAGRTLPEIATELGTSDFEVALLLHDLTTYRCLEVDREALERPVGSTVDRIANKFHEAQEHLLAQRFDEAEAAYQEVMRIDPVNLNARKGVVAVVEARKIHSLNERVPRDALLVPQRTAVELLNESLDPQEGFVVSRILDETSVGAVLQLCPMPEEETLMVLSRLIERGLITQRRLAQQAEAAPAANGANRKS